MSGSEGGRVVDAHFSLIVRYMDIDFYTRALPRL